jgi:alkanesulfonate monooxygenase SsuD/methylene tetrahydromethanopterin reductase-like flavin-dependent oxidoreductase (luciferase family)
VHFGLFLPPFDEFAEPRRVMALATSAEDAGWDGLFLWDHMLAGPGVAVADPWVTMAAIATSTTRLRFGALVTPLPRRRPWVLARQMATLDRLSAGRLVAGVGVGDDGWSEFSSFGEPEDPVVRGEVLDEALDLLQRFLAGNEVHHRGRHFVVDSTALLPRPRQDPLPIWGACRWPHRKPVARAAKLHGCFPIFPVDGPPPPPAPSDIAAIRRMLADFGARPDLDLVIRCALSLEDPAGVAETVSSLDDAGVTWILEGFGPGQPPVTVVESIVGRGPPALA